MSTGGPNPRPPAAGPPDRDPLDRESLDLDDELRIDALCMRFEAAHRAGGEPRVADYLAEAPEALRDALEAELHPLLEELRAPGGVGGPPPTPAHDLPERFGRYRILRRIGEGGMGTVFEAEQDEPRRRVALKVVRADLVSPRMLRRFRREIRVLGHLHHPGIAQIYDAGTAQTGEDGAETPYLAMEYVDGLPLLRHADEHGLDVRARIALVQRVCAAIQHAHDQGVVHRDLKPANILVRAPDSTGGETLRGGRAPLDVGRPVVLDFGVARAAGRTPLATLETQAGQLVGTLSHMSPEQLSGDPDAVDARTDVYALGVVLYELLGRRLPVELRGLPLARALERLNTSEPPPLGTLDEHLRGDVEIVVAKALERDRERRYDSAAELGADLLRYLEDEPIRARRPSALYQLEKFARRNRALVAGLGSAAVLLLASLAVVSWLAARQTALRAGAEQARDDARDERDKAEAVARFQRRMLGRANLDHGGRPAETTLLEVLAWASEEVETAFPHAPTVEAAVRVTLGQAYLSLQELEPAGAHLTRALDVFEAQYGTVHADTQRAVAHLARVAEEDGRLEQARGLHERSLRLAEALHAGDHATVATALNNLAALCEVLGDYDEAGALHRRALAMRERLYGPEHDEVAASLNNLAGLLSKGGRYDEARALHGEALTMRERLFGPRHPQVATSLNNLGAIAWFEEDFAEAARLMLRALDIQKAHYGPDHPQTRVYRANAMAVLTVNGDWEGARRLQLETLEILRGSLGEDHEETLTALFRLARCEHELGAVEDAERLFVGTLGRALELLGDHPTTARGHEDWGKVLAGRERFEEALEHLRAAVAMRERLAPDQVAAFRALRSLAEATARSGARAEGAAIALDAARRAAQALGADHPDARRLARRAAELGETP